MACRRSRASPSNLEQQLLAMAGALIPNSTWDRAAMKLKESRRGTKEEGRVHAKFHARQVEDSAIQWIGLESEQKHLFSYYFGMSSYASARKATVS